MYNNVNRVAAVRGSGGCRGVKGGCGIKLVCPQLFVGIDGDDRLWGTQGRDLIVGLKGDDYVPAE